ncbi:uncharacterized protein [Venturia canescens]|uniref:uncharacterized protein n=1 Tax=Venturia canescens TaxID=32260 RepID=UPI001C9C3F6F|nr:uncharacterized protein LOC122416733 [Venturia canescens]
MTTETILIKGRHVALLNADDVPVIDANGNLLVRDLKDNNIFTLPLCEDVMAFFNLSIMEIPAIEPSISDVELMDTSTGAFLLEVEPKSDTRSVTPLTDSSGALLTSDRTKTAPKLVAASTTSSGASWKDDNEVRCLIHLWHEHLAAFKNKKSREVWASVAQKLSETQPEWRKKTGVQCENKIKDIKRKYTETKDHNNKSGNDPKSCKFYEELDEILSEKPNITPVALASNLQKRKISDFEDSNDGSECSTASTQEKKPPGKKKKIDQQLKDWSAALLEDVRTREAAKEQRHQEMLAAIKASSETYREMMSKLIDKL